MARKLPDNTGTATIGKTVDDAMVAIKRDNPRLKGVLPKDYTRPGLDTVTGARAPLCQFLPLVGAHRSVTRLGQLGAGSSTVHAWESHGTVAATHIMWETGEAAPLIP